MAQKSTPARKRSARAHPVEVDAHQLEVFALFNEIAIIDQLRSTRFARTLPHGLTHSQFGVLNHFVRLEGVYSPKQLANAFQVSKAAMTKRRASPTLPTAVDRSLIFSSR